MWADGYQGARSGNLITSRIWDGFGLGATAVISALEEVPPSHTILVWAWLEAMRLIKINCSALQRHRNTCRTLNIVVPGIPWTWLGHAISSDVTLSTFKAEQNILKGTVHKPVSIWYPAVARGNQSCCQILCHPGGLSCDRSGWPCCSNLFPSSQLHIHDTELQELMIQQLLWAMFFPPLRPSAFRAEILK